MAKTNHAKDKQQMHRKLKSTKYEQHAPHQNPGVISGALRNLQIFPLNTNYAGYLVVLEN